MSLFWHNSGLSLSEVPDFDAYLGKPAFDFHPSLEEFVNLISGFFTDKPRCWLQHQVDSSGDDKINAGTTWENDDVKISIYPKSISIHLKFKSYFATFNYDPEASIEKIASQPNTFRTVECLTRAASELVNSDDVLLYIAL